jgi:hypothetical protein
MGKKGKESRSKISFRILPKPNIFSSGGLHFYSEGEGSSETSIPINLQVIVTQKAVTFTLSIAKVSNIIFQICTEMMNIV